MLWHHILYGGSSTPTSQPSREVKTEVPVPETKIVFILFFPFLQRRNGLISRWDNTRDRKGGP
jgi:hypothetical protein